VLDSGLSVGMSERLSASTNESQLYVAIKDGPPGLAVVRVSTTLAVVDAQIHAIQRAVAAAGLLMLFAAGLVAWLLARVLARPLLRIADAARTSPPGGRRSSRRVRPGAGASGGRAPRHASRAGAALRRSAREREESRTLLEALSDGVLAADRRGIIVSTNAAARRLLGYGESESLPPLGELFTTGHTAR